MTSARTQTQQTLGDWGINNVGDIQALAGDLVEEFCLSCKFDKYNVGNADTVFRGNAVDLFQIFEPYYANLGNPNNITGNEFDRVGEKIWSAYAQYNWDGQLAERPVQIVAGLRWENTKTTSFSRVDQPLRIEWDSDNDFTRVVSGNIAEITRGGEYNKLLPSIDFRIEPMDDLCGPCVLLARRSLAPITATCSRRSRPTRLIVPRFLAVCPAATRATRTSSR